MAEKVYYPQARAILHIVFDGFGDEDADSEPLVLGVMPKRAVVHRNSYRQPDSWELTFDAGDLPIDPALIRAGAVEIFLFSTDGVLPAQQLIDLQNPPRLADRVSNADENDRFTLGNRPMVAGLFDDGSIELGEDGRWVTISGQDYTAFLGAKQWPPTATGRARRIPTGARLDVWLRDIIREADPGQRLNVFVDVDESTLPVVGKDEISGNKRGIPIQQDTSYWDVIYKTVTRYGFIVFVRGLDVVIALPKNLPNLKDPSIKRMGWGRNLESLRMTRHYGKAKAPRILVHGYDPDSRRLVVEEYPRGSLERVGSGRIFKTKTSNRTRETIRSKSATTSKKKVPKESVKLDDTFVIIPAFGVNDRSVLQRMAESLFQQLGRSERKVVAVTRDLDDIEGSSLMNLAAGDAVDIEWMDFNREFIADPRNSSEAKVAYLRSIGFGSEVSATIANGYERLFGIKRPFRVSEVSYEYDDEDGIRIEMELIDFVVVGGVRDGESVESRKSTRDERLPRNDDGSPLGSGALVGRRSGG